jgi:hypothetical protein
VQYQLLIVDLDGTALREDGTVHPRDVAASRALAEIGVQLTVNTGRLFPGTRDAASQLGVTGSVALMNGAEMVNATTGVATFGHYFDASQRDTAKHVLRFAGLTSFVFGSRRIHHSHSAAHHAPYLQTWTPSLSSHDDVFSADSWHDDDVLAVGAVGSPDGISEAISALPHLNAFRFPIDRDRHFVKFRVTEEDKGTAVGRLCRERDVAIGRSVVLGDWLNDVPMMRTAARAFAMNGSVPEVIEAADEVVSAQRSQGGGIADVAARVWGIETP